MSLDDVLKQINKDFKKELAVKGIGEFIIKRILCYFFLNESLPLS